MYRRSHASRQFLFCVPSPNRQAPLWDANGNLTQDGITNHQPFGSSTVFNFVYDYRNRLVAVKDNSNPKKLFLKFEYDGLNRRIRKIKYDGNGEASGNETADTWFLWSGWPRCPSSIEGRQAIEERDHNSSDAVLRRYAYGVGGLDDQAALLTPNGENWDIYYYLKDRLGSVTALADSSGAVVERYDYEPYGQWKITDETGGTDRTSSGSSYGNSFGFTGQYYDYDVGLYYYKNRWYSPDLGRFTTRDPMGYIDSENLYEYVSSLPTAAWDPLGLEGAKAGANHKKWDELSEKEKKRYTDAIGKANKEAIEKLKKWCKELKQAQPPNTKAQALAEAALRAAQRLQSALDAGQVKVEDLQSPPYNKGPNTHALAPGNGTMVIDVEDAEAMAGGKSKGIDVLKDAVHEATHLLQEDKVRQVNKDAKDSADMRDVRKSFESEAEAELAANAFSTLVQGAPPNGSNAQDMGKMLVTMSVNMTSAEFSDVPRKDCPNDPYFKPGAIGSQQFDKMSKDIKDPLAGERDRYTSNTGPATREHPAKPKP